MEIAYETKVEFLNQTKERKLHDLRAYTVALWIDRELRFGGATEAEIIQDLEDSLLTWLVENEQFIDAIWLRDELRKVRDGIKLRYGKNFSRTA